MIRSSGWGAVRWHRVGDADSASSGSTDVLVDSADTTAGFLDAKLSPGAGLTRTITNPGGNEVLRLDVVANADGSILVHADDIQVNPTLITTATATALAAKADAATTTAALATKADAATTTAALATKADAATTTAALATKADAATTTAALATKADALGLVASWSTTIVRYFLLDYDGGNDANTGFVDAAAGSTVAPAGLAIKTFERFFQIFSKLGAGRAAVVLVKPRAAGATYLQQDAATPSDVDLTGFSGYASFDLRGSSDLTNSATDRVLCGAIQGQAGPGGSGEWTCAAGATTTVFSVGSGALTAEPGILGMRVRFTGNVTGALAGVCAFISANTGTQITVGAALGAAPANGDTFFIEIPGVRVNTLIGTMDMPSRGVSSVRAMRQSYVGIAAVRDAANSMVFGGGDTQVAFCETTGTSNVQHLVAEALQQSTFQKTYTDEAGNARVVGFGVRCRGDFLVQDMVNLQWTEFAHVSATATVGATRFLRCLTGQVGLFGMYLNRGGTFQHCGFRDSHPSNQAILIGGGRQAALIAMRSIGALSFNACNAAIQGIDVTQAGATGAFTISNPSTSYVQCLDRLSGSTGNTGVGLDLLGASRTNLLIGSGVVCTATGTAGDVKLPGSVIMSYTALAATISFKDQNLNQIIGSSLPRCQDVALILTNGDGTAHAVGELVRQSAATTCLRAQADTAAHATGPLLVAVTDPAAGAGGYYVPLSGNLRYLLFDAAPTSLAIAYVSPTTAGRATTTVPAVSGTNQKRRLGLVEIVSGSTGITQCQPDNLPIAADGAA
jgi:hypothetical protein